MAITSFSKFILLSGVALGVSACQTAQTYQSALPADAEKARVFAVDGDLGTATMKGTTLSSRPGLGAVFQKTTTAASLQFQTEPSTLKATRNADGSFTIVMDGRSFVAQQPGPDESRLVDLVAKSPATNNNDLVVYVSNADRSRTIDGWVSPGRGYHTVLNTADRTNIGSERLGFYVIGTETKDADLSGLGQATYVGTAAMASMTDQTSVDPRKALAEQRSLGGVVSLDADFTKGTIKGRIDRMWVGKSPRSDGTSSTPDITRTYGDIVLEETGLTGNGYSGNVSVEQFNYLSSSGGTSGTYTGAFFGPKAEETAGVIEIDTKPSTQYANGGRKTIGTFSAKK